MPIWAVQFSNGTWYVPEGTLLDEWIVRDSRRAKAFFVLAEAEKSQSHYAGSNVVPHPHPELFKALFAEDKR